MIKYSIDVERESACKGAVCITAGRFETSVPMPIRASNVQLAVAARARREHIRRPAIAPLARRRLKRIRMRQ